MIVATILTENAFITTWKTDNAGSSLTNQISIPTYSTGIYSCFVDWGDGKSNYINTYNDAAWTHTYSVAGTYTIKIFGKFVGLQFNNAGDKLKILNVLKWGQDFRLGVGVSGHFYGCSNLAITATDVLQNGSNGNLEYTFRGCTSITTIPKIEYWDTSRVTSMLGTFYGCTNFNSPLTYWDTSSVINMTSMFNGATAFNKPLSNFNTSACVQFGSMFQGATAFNQDVSSFSIAALTTATNMFTSSGFTITNYDKLLNLSTGWPSQAKIQPNVTFSAGTAHYSAGAPTTGRTYLTGTKLWTITDGGTP